MKIILTLLCASLLCGCNNSSQLATGGKLQGAEESPRWQYTDLHWPNIAETNENTRLTLRDANGTVKDFSAFGYTSALNILGNYGWEVIHVTEQEKGKTFLLKRHPREDGLFWLVSIKPIKL